MAFVIDDILIYAALATAAVGTQQSMQAADEAEEAAGVKSAQEEIRQRNEKQRTVREGRIARAQAQQAAANTGVSDSSLEVGGTGSIQTQVGANLALLTGEENASKGISQHLKSQASFQQNAQSFQALGSVFSSLNSMGASGSATPTEKPIV